MVGIHEIQIAWVDGKLLRLLNTWTAELDFLYHAYFSSPEIDVDSTNDQPHGSRVKSR